MSDLLEWMSSQPSKAFADLNDWRRLDLAELQDRISKNHDYKPRIEISAEITKMRNLSVRWHPGGWRDSKINRGRSTGNQINLIEIRKWLEPPDFQWFEGDEDPYFDSRPSNELMYLRGVGNLRPEPHTEFYGSYNRDVLHSILICAVRSAYESLVEQLKFGFDVKINNAFDFVTRDELDEKGADAWAIPTRRVVKWTLEDADRLNAERERVAAEAKARQDREEFDGLNETFGFSLEEFASALVHGCSKKATGVAPSLENADRNAAKELRNAGFKIDAGQVRRIRALAERYRPDILPEAFRPAPPPQKAGLVPSPSNVVKFLGQAD